MTKSSVEDGTVTVTSVTVSSGPLGRIGMAAGVSILLAPVLWGVSRFGKRKAFCHVAATTALLPGLAAAESLIRTRPQPPAPADTLSKENNRQIWIKESDKTWFLFALAGVGGAILGSITKAPSLTSTMGWRRAVGMGIIYSGPVALGTEMRSIQSMQAIHTLAQFKGPPEEEEAKTPYVLGPEGLLACRNYDWNEKEVSEEDIRTQIEALAERRPRLAAEAEYLWTLIARKEDEHLKLVRENADEKEIDLLKREMVLLSGLHVKLWQTVAETDWRVADLRKILKRVKGEQYLPEPRYNLIQQTLLRNTISNISDHLGNLRNEKLLFDAMHRKAGALDGETLEQLQTVYNSIEANRTASSRLLRELEDLVEKAEPE